MLLAACQSREATLGPMSRGIPDLSQHLAGAGEFPTTWPGPIEDLAFVLSLSMGLSGTGMTCPSDAVLCLWYSQCYFSEEKKMP